MRVVKYPEPEQEIFVTCSKCGAELAYTGSDCFWENGFAGDVKFIICPCCGIKIRIDYTPYPIQIGKEFYYFNEGIMCYIINDNKRITRCKSCGSQVIYFTDEVEPIYNSIVGIIICPHCGAEIEVLQF